MTIDYYLLAQALGRIRSSELTHIAAQLLTDGHDSAGLTQLAGAMPGELSPAEIDDLWARSLRELQREVPSRREAALEMRRYYARRVADGDLSPAEGASEIVNLSHEAEGFPDDREWAGDGFGIAKLLGLFYAYDDVAEGDDGSMRRIDAEIKGECVRLAGVSPGVV